MATLASLTVALGIDTDEVGAGARRASAAIRSIGRTVSGMTQDADGNWRSLDGRVMSSAHAMMTNGQRMRDALGGVGQVMRSLGGTVATGMRNGLTAAGNAGMTTLGGLSKAFGVMSVGAIGAAGAMAAVPLAVLGLGVKVAAENKQVQAAFTGLKDHVTKTMQSLAQPLVKPLEQAAGQMKGIFDSIAPDLGKLFKAAGPMIQPLVEGIGGLVKGLVSGMVPIMEKAGPLVESLGGLFKSLGDGLSGFLSGLSSGIGSAGAVFDGLGSVIGALLPTLGQLMGTILQVAGPILGKLLTGLAPVIETLGAALQPVIVALGPVLDALVDAFLALVQAVLPLLPVAAQLIVALLPALTPILQALVPLFGALGQVVAALVPILIPIIQIVAKLAALFGEGLALIITSVLVPAVQAIAALLRGDFSKAADLAKTALSNAGRIIVAIFTDLPGKVWAAVKPLATKLGAVALEAGSKFLNYLKQKGKDALNYVGSLPGKAKSVLGNLGGVLKSAGISLIKGFIDGIVSQFANVKSQLGKLTSKLTDWKGPAPLDKRILTPNGRMVIGGFMRGIADQTPHVKRQLQGLTSDLPGMAMDVSPKGVMSASVRQAQQVVFDVTGADEDMKRLIRRIVKTQGRGNVQTAFGTY